MFARRRILLIEDDKVVSTYFDSMLRKIFEVDTVSTLADGIKLLKNSNDGYDVILLDLMLPNGQGVATFLTIKEQTKLPIIVVTGCGKHLIDTCVSLGAKGYLEKGFFNADTLWVTVITTIIQNEVHKDLKLLNDTLNKMQVMQCS